jgi:hypothetical protein
LERDGSGGVAVTSCKSGGRRKQWEEEEEEEEQNMRLFL